MRKVKHISDYEGGKFNTLVQSGTTHSLKIPQLLKGNGSDLHNSGAIQGRAKRKLVTQSLSLCLIDVAKKKGDRDMVKQLWNVYHCQEKVFTHYNKLHAEYCKNRICTVCATNRKANIINKYLPVLDKWVEPCFVTLTIKSVSAKNLKRVIDNMLYGVRKIIVKQKKTTSKRQRH